VVLGKLWNKIIKHSLLVSQNIKSLLFTLIFCLHFPAIANTSATESAPMPAVQVQEDSLTQYPHKAGAETTVSPELAACQDILVNEDIESRYKKIQDALEADYAQGMPKQLKTDLVRVREDIDGLSVKLFEVDTKDNQEVNHIVQLTIDYLEKMISLLPKANRIAPKVRDRYVIPFTNISSVKAEHQECLMKAAIEGVKEKELASNEPSINIYKQLTTELERLNSNLYVLQTSDVQRFISYRSRLLRGLEAYNKTNENGSSLTAEIPQILNNVHREIEKLIPGLELSKDYLTVAH
jgi:hypothetical protein